MSGQCIDCVWQTRGRCNRPHRDTGFPIDRACGEEREAGWLLAWLDDTCGRGGRHFWLGAPLGDIDDAPHNAIREAINASRAIANGGV